MTDENGQPGQNDGAALNALVADCLAAVEESGPGIVDEFCRRHPEHAAVLRRRLDTLLATGLLDDPGLVPPLPERLGDYRVLGQLGTGGMGVVYRARQEGLDREVAIKTIRPELLASSDARARFRREVSTVARLSHPGIVPVYTSGEQDGLPWFAMEWIGGASLAAILGGLAERPVTSLDGEALVVALRGIAGAEPDSANAVFRGSWLEAGITIGRQIAAALDHAHRAGVLHRDVKPSNVLLGLDGSARLLDFGLARPESAEQSVELTRTGAMVGSLPYMAPEQVQGEAADRRTDVYGLAATLVEWFTLAPPFPERSGEALRTAILSGRPPGLAARGVGLPRDLIVVLEKALEHDPDRRYSTAADFARDLQAVLELQPIAARTAGPLLRAQRWARRRPAAAVASFAVAVALIAVPIALLITNASIQSALEVARAEQERAEASLDVAIAAIDRMVHAGEDRLGVVPRMEEVRRAMLEEALVLHRRLAAATGEQRLRLRTVTALAGLARVQAQLGERTRAINNAIEARALLARLPSDGHDEVTVTELGAELAFSQALWSRAVERPQAEVDALLDAAEAGADRLLALDLPSSRQRLLAAKICALRGELLRGADAAAARVLFDRAERLVRPLLEAPAEHAALLPKLLATLAQRAKFLVEAGDVEAAKAAADELHETIAAEFDRDDDMLHRARLVPAMVELSTVWYRTEDFARVVDALEPAIATQRELARNFPALPAHRQGLGTALINTALAQERIGKLDTARGNTREAIELFERLVEEHPESSENRERVLQAMINLAHHSTVRARFGARVDWTEAEAALDKGLELARSEIFTTNETGRIREHRAELARVRGIVHSHQRQHARAAEWQRAALAGYEELAAQAPDALWLAGRIVDLRENLARSLIALHDNDGAAPLVESALALQRRIAPRLAQAVHARIQERELIELATRIDIARGQLSAVESNLDAMLALAPDPANDWIGRDTVARLALLAIAAAAPGSQERERFEQRCRKEIEAATANAPGSVEELSPMHAVMRSNSLRTLVELELELGNKSAAAASQSQVTAGYRRAWTGQQTARNKQRLASNLQRLAELREAADDHSGAGAARRELDELGQD